MFQSKKEEAMSAIRGSFNVLTTEQNLSPKNETVTRSLTQLVRELTESSTSDEVTAFLLQTPDLKAERDNLPELCGAAEGEMEKYWSERIAADPEARLSDFWYYPEYVELTRAETALMDGRTFGSIAFLGSGALPMTAFLLAEIYPQAKITCVDYDPVACVLAEALTRKLGLAGRISIRCMDAADFRPERGQLIICASLLNHRSNIYDRADETGSALIVRDSEGIYQFLYKSADLPEKGFREVSKTAIDPKRINTSRYFEPLKRAA